MPPTYGGGNASSTSCASTSYPAASGWLASAYNSLGKAGGAT